ncbi:MAG: hypothetical protein HZC28_16390 [Spirochaetes bacterium]|nr:hypothetical protein [Spirochaetota bacterium]
MSHCCTKFIILSIVIAAVLYPKSFTYVTVTTNTYVTNTQTVSFDAVSNLYVVRSDYGAADFISAYSADYLTRWWRVANKVRNTDLRITVEKNTAVVTGTFRGTNITRSAVMKPGIPYFASFDLAGKYLLASKKESMDFLILRFGDFEFFEMTIKNMGNESITVGGKSIRAVHVRVTPSGMLAMFWHADYWFRPSDNEYVKFIGSQGPPGTPESIIELIAEKQ